MPYYKVYLSDDVEVDSDTKDSLAAYFGTDTKVESIGFDPNKKSPYAVINRGNEITEEEDKELRKRYEILDIKKMVKLKTLSESIKEKPVNEAVDFSSLEKYLNQEPKYIITYYIEPMKVRVERDGKIIFESKVKSFGAPNDDYGRFLKWMKKQFGSARVESGGDRDNPTVIVISDLNAQDVKTLIANIF